MNRVRYLAGAVGMAPMAFGMAGLAAATPGTTRPNCDADGNWAELFCGSSAHIDCFADNGAVNLDLPRFDSMFTGNN
jgi:hypothetical protein